MSTALRKPMTVAEFLQWEERQDLRYEFDGERPVAMTGGTLTHDDITFNVRKALDARLGQGPCRPFGPNAKILVAGKVRYPDVVASYAPQHRAGTIVQAPVVVFEVLSASSSHTDRIEKSQEYLATEFDPALCDPGTGQHLGDGARTPRRRLAIHDRNRDGCPGHAGTRRQPAARRMLRRRRVRRGRRSRRPGRRELTDRAKSAGSHAWIGGSRSRQGISCSSTVASASSVASSP